MGTVLGRPNTQQASGGRDEPTTSRSNPARASEGISNNGDSSSQGVPIQPAQAPPSWLSCLQPSDTISSITTATTPSLSTMVAVPPQRRVSLRLESRRRVKARNAMVMPHGDRGDELPLHMSISTMSIPTVSISTVSNTNGASLQHTHMWQSCVLRVLARLPFPMIVSSGLSLSCNVRDC